MAYLGAAGDPRHVYAEHNARCNEQPDEREMTIGGLRAMRLGLCLKATPLSRKRFRAWRKCVRYIVTTSMR